MFKTKTMIAAVSMALGLGVANGVQAAAANINTGADGVISVTNLDWTQTSFLAQGGNTAISNFIGSGGTCLTPGSCDFTVLTHASLGAFQNPGGVNLSTPGLNVTYELTMVAKFTERVTSVVGSTVTFALQPTPTDVLFYYDILTDGTGLKANPLTGSGYNDGRLVLTGNVIQTASGLFTISDTTPVVFDQSGVDNYPGQLTLPGIGTQATIRLGGIAQDNAFFLNPLIDFALNFQNISQQTPFENVNPSDCFTQAFLGTAVGGSNNTFACDATHVAAPYAGQGAPLDANGYVPVTGTVNGLLPIVSDLGGPDFVAQTDFNSGLSAIPEPGSLALIGLGLGLLGLGARRRRPS